MFHWKELNDWNPFNRPVRGSHGKYEIVRTVLQIMSVNNTCVSGNNTSTCVDPSSAAGPPAWPAVFLLLLLIPAGVVGYKYRSKIRKTFQSARRRSQKKEERHEASGAESHTYIHVRGQRSTKQMPIYENLTTQKAKSNAGRANQKR